MSGSPRLASLSHGRRAALEIRLAVAVAFRSCTLPGVTERALAVLNERVLRPLLGEANVLRTIDLTRSAEALDRLRAASNLVRLADLADAGDCQQAIKKRIVECTNLIDHAIASGIGTRVPEEISRLFRSLDDFVAALYQDSCSLNIARPEVHIDLGYVDSEEIGDALSGSCRLKLRGFGGDRRRTLRLMPA
jgi:hypothetical protein